MSGGSGQGGRRERMGVATRLDGSTRDEFSVAGLWQS